MNSFLQSDSKLYTALETYREWFIKNRNNWKPDFDKSMDESKDKLRVIQLFYNSPQECLKGEIAMQHLEWKDINIMYPKLIEKVKSLKDDEYLLIINVNDGIKTGMSLQQFSVV
jgi:hypothetical protein